MSFEDTLREHFECHVLVHNPPETEVIWRPELYEYVTAKNADSSLRSSIGRLLMAYEAREPNEWPFLKIVGIAIDGRGRVHEVILPGSKTLYPDEFAQIAVQHFLPEEIHTFLQDLGHFSVTLEELQQIPVQEVWGDWADHEDLGRIKEYWRSSPEEGHVLSADFVNTRVKVHSIEIAFVQDEGEWKKLRAQYFPKDWKGWPKTKGERRLAEIAARL